jgi:hypothetical protein
MPSYRRRYGASAARGWSAQVGSSYARAFPKTLDHQRPGYSAAQIRCIDELDAAIRTRPKGWRWLCKVRKLFLRHGYPTQAQLDYCNRVLGAAGLGRLSCPVRVAAGSERPKQRLRRLERERAVAELDALWAQPMPSPPRKEQS